MFLRFLGRTAIASLALSVSAAAFAADHAEAPAAAADPAADIGDVYAWHTDSSLMMVVTFAPFGTAEDEATYDPDVLYGFHIDTNDDNGSDRDVWVRFGQNEDGAWGVQAVGMTPDDTELVGPVAETVTHESGARIYAGYNDDPFFFDLTGYTETLATGDLSFDSTRDSLAGLNITAIVAEIPLETVGASSFQIWATTSRL
jgi:hypothetical protein